MKRVFTILFAGIYLLLSIGVFAHIHSCHNVVTEISIVNESSCCEDESSCSTLHTNTSTNTVQHETCCTNESLYVHLSEDTQLPNSLSQKIFVASITIEKVQLPLLYTESFINGIAITDFAPPPKIPLYTLYSSNLLYS